MDIQCILIPVDVRWIQRELHTTCDPQPLLFPFIP